MTPPSTPNAHLPSLEGLRAICIAWVVGRHAVMSEGFPSDWTSVWLYFFSGVGVQVFFVLSGFLITLLLTREAKTNGRISLTSFYARRLVRIFPVYLVFVLVLALLDAFTRVDISTCGYLTTLTYTKNYGCGQWIDGHLWSLGVEEQFYLLWPWLMVFVTPAWRGRTALLMILLAPLLRVLLHVLHFDELRQFSFFTNMDALMFGCVVGALAGANSPLLLRWLSWHPTWMRFAAAALFYAVWVMQVRFAFAVLTVPFANTLQAASAAYLIGSYATIPGGPVYAALNFRPIRYLGVLSYSLYIWQQLFFAPSGTYSEAAPFFLRFPYNIGAAVLTAMLSYHLLEMPLLGLRKRMRAVAKTPS